MTRRCRYCDQVLLEDEAVCWQCGRPVAEQESPAAATNKPLRESWYRKEEDSFSFSALSVYTLLTILVVAGATLATLYLGRQPRLELGTGETLPPEWLWVNENNNDFLLALPRAWRLIDPETDPEEAALKELVLSRPSLQRSLQPWAQLDEDLAIAVFAEGLVPPTAPPQSEATVLVARSRLLNQLTLSEIVALAPELEATSETELVEAMLVAATPGLQEEHATFIVDIAHAGTDGVFRCRQQIVPGRVDSYILSTCADPGARFQTSIDRIDNSFQRLAP